MTERKKGVIESEMEKEREEEIKVVIVGPGAIGCLFAAFLTQAGHLVWLLDKNPARAREIRKNGVFIEGVSEPRRVKVKITTNLSQVGEVDLLILCVKFPQTESALERVKNIISSRTYLLSFQNGIGHQEIIRKYLPPRKIMMGVTYEGVINLGGGKIKHTGRGETIISGQDISFLKKICQLFNQAGFKTKIKKNIEEVIWSKLVINAGINPLAAITELKNGQLLQFKETKVILKKLVLEAAEVAQRKGIKLLYQNPWQKVKEVCARTADNYCSMLQDIFRHRPTEIDGINGAVVREARKQKILVPVNETLVNLVKMKERRYENKKG